MDIDTVNQIFLDLIHFLPKLGAALLLFIAFWVIARIIRGAVQRFGRTRHLSKDVLNMMEQVTETVLLVFGGVSALGTLGIDIGAMIAGLGLVGFALGFALKDVVSNFMAGFLILLYTPFVRGDHVEVAGNQGTVIEINMRYTVLKAEEKRILIPNATLFANAVIVKRSATAERLPGGDSGA